MSITRKVLFEQMQANFVRAPAGLAGACQFVVDGAHAETFHVVLGERSLAYAEGEHPTPAAVVRLMPDVLDRLVESPETFDVMNPEIARKFSVDGDLRLAWFIAQLTKRPTREIEGRLLDAERRTRGRTFERVERLERPSADDVLDALADVRPIVARDLLVDWPAMSWSLRELSERFGRETLGMKSMNEEWTLGELLTSMIASRPATSNGVDLPAGLRAVLRPPLFAGERALDVDAAQFWAGSALGPSKPITRLHRDGRHGMLCHVMGRKKFVLYSPAQAAYLYPFSAYNTGQPCWVEPAHPDFDAYPLFAQAKPLEVVLEPGDVLIQPAGWFHEVYALDPVVSVSYFMFWEFFDAQRPQKA